MKRSALILTAFFMLVGTASAYNSHGVYQTMGELPRDWHTPYALVRGIPLIDYGTFHARNPVTTSQWGLANYSLWKVFHDKKRLQTATRAANWLVKTQQPDGGWTYKFEFMPPGSQFPLQSGWESSLAQAQALSLLERIYTNHPKPKYLRAITRGLRPLTRSVARGGLQRWFNRGLYFEEYPTVKRNFSFNGDLQTLIGLYDVTSLLPRAGKLFEHGMRALLRNIYAFDSGNGFSVYSLASPTQPPSAYNIAIRDELRILAEVADAPLLAQYAQRWNAP